MGDWSVEPWGSDEAADWFHRFWEGGGFPALVSEIRDFDPRQERYDSVRAACYLLQTLGIVYVWPAKYSAELKPLLEQAIVILSNMIAPPDDDWGFLEMGGNVPALVAAVESQIDALKKRLSET